MVHYRIILTYILNVTFGLLYPTAKSIEAVETGHDDAQWLMYWILYSVLLIAETLLWPVLKWVPLYGELKALLLAWLVLPNFKGATWIYDNIVGPGFAELKKEAMKIPAIEKMLTQQQHQDGAAGTAGQGPVAAPAPPEDDAAFYAGRKTRVTLIVQDVRDSLVDELERINTISDPRTKAKAQKAFDKDVSKINNVVSSQKSHAA